MKEKNSFSLHIKQNFITGLLLLLPFIGTIYVLYILIKFSNKLLKILIPFKGIPEIPGLGLLLAFIIIYLIGFFSNRYFGKKLLFYWEQFLQKIPGIRGIYTSIKKITQNITVIDRSRFLKVVAIEYPRKGIFAIGFVTSEKNFIKNGEKDNLVTLFIPTSPNPTSGFVILAPEEELIPLDISIDDAFSFIISGGIYTPGGENDQKRFSKGSDSK